jgi:hypothetical protein
VIECIYEPSVRTYCCILCAFCPDHPACVPCARACGLWASQSCLRVYLCSVRLVAPAAASQARQPGRLNMYTSVFNQPATTPSRLQICAAHPGTSRSIPIEADTAFTGSWRALHDLHFHYASALCMYGWVFTVCVCVYAHIVGTQMFVLCFSILIPY